MSSKSLLMTPMDLQLPPTPPMDLSDQNSNSSTEYKVSFSQRKIEKVQWRVMKKMWIHFRAPKADLKKNIFSHFVNWVTNKPDAISLISLLKTANLVSLFVHNSLMRAFKGTLHQFVTACLLIPWARTSNENTNIQSAAKKKFTLISEEKITRMRRH